MPPKTTRDEEPAAPTATRHFRRSRRLRRPAEFAAVLATPRPQSLRLARHWLAMTAAWSRSERAAVRFGVTVGKRNARRAVDRGLVKRILREAGRAAAPELEHLCTQRQLRLDVAFRLKASRDRAAGTAVSLQVWRHALREEADALLARLGRQLSAAQTR